MPTPDFDARKFKEAVLYIAWKSQEDRKFGATKLNKILHTADFEAYALLGTPITGATYKHRQNGPAPYQMVPIRDELIEQGDVAIQRVDYYGRRQDRLIPLRIPNLDLFSPEEIAIIDDALVALHDKNGKEASDASHLTVGYILTEMDEDIPYHSVFVDDEPLTVWDRERARELAAEHGW